QELAGVEFGGPEAILAVDLAAPRTGHGRRRLVLGVFDRLRIEDADLAFLPDIKMSPAPGIGVGVVDSPVLRDLENGPLQLFAVQVDLHQIAVALEVPEIAVGIQTKHGAARRPAHEPARLRIVFDGAVIHADNDIAVAIELQLVCAAAGSA